MSKRAAEDVNWERLDKMKFYVYGAGLFSGVTLTLYPLSVIKIRQMASSDVPAGLKGVTQTANNIWRTDGLPGFYRGLSTVLFGTIPARVVYLSTLELVKSSTTKVCQSLDWSEPATAGLSNFLGGASASLATQAVTCPVDVVSQRQMVHMAHAEGATSAASVAAKNCAASGVPALGNEAARVVANCNAAPGAAAGRTASAGSAASQPACTGAFHGGRKTLPAEHGGHLGTQTRLHTTWAGARTFTREPAPEQNVRLHSGLTVNTAPTPRCNALSMKQLHASMSKPVGTGCRLLWSESKPAASAGSRVGAPVSAGCQTNPIMMSKSTARPATAAPKPSWAGTAGSHRTGGQGSCSTVSAAESRSGTSRRTVQPQPHRHNLRHIMQFMADYAIFLKPRTSSASMQWFTSVTHPSTAGFSPAPPACKPWEAVAHSASQVAASSVANSTARMPHPAMTLGHWFNLYASMTARNPSMTCRNPSKPYPNTHYYSNMSPSLFSHRNSLHFTSSRNFLNACLSSHVSSCTAFLCSHAKIIRSYWPSGPIPTYSPSTTPQHAMRLHPPHTATTSSSSPSTTPLPSTRMSGISMARLIVQQEGIRGLYRGFGASIATYAPSSAVWWGAYGLYQKLVWMVMDATASSRAPWSTLLHPATLMVESTAAAISTSGTHSSSNPVQVQHSSSSNTVQAQHSSSAEPTRHSSGSTSTLPCSGPAPNSLYRTGAAPFSPVAQLSTTPSSKDNHQSHIFVSATRSGTAIVAVQTVSALAAGLTSASLTNPLDLIKTRLQVAQRQQGVPLTFLSVARQLLQEEGLRGMWRGVAPRMVSAALWGTAMVTTYEFLKRICRLPDEPTAVAGDAGQS